MPSFLAMKPTIHHLRLLPLIVFGFAVASDPQYGSCQAVFRPNSPLFIGFCALLSCTKAKLGSKFRLSRDPRLGHAYSHHTSLYLKVSKARTRQAFRQISFCLGKFVEVKACGAFSPSFLCNATASDQGFATQPDTQLRERVCAPSASILQSLKALKVFLVYSIEWK